MYESGQLTPGFNPVSEAMRPTGGGNNPLNLGGVGATGGDMGRYLSTISNVEPFEVWKELLPNDAPSFNRYVERYFDEHGNGVRPSDISSDHGTLLYEQARALLKEAVDNFSNTVNPIRIANNQSPIPTYSAVENIMPSFNSWIYEGPYKKYITTQMGTGAATDPALKAIEQYNLPLATKELHDWVPENAAERREKVLGILNQAKESGAIAKPEMYENVGKQTAVTPYGIEHGHRGCAHCFTKIYHCLGHTI